MARSSGPTDQLRSRGRARAPAAAAAGARHDRRAIARRARRAVGAVRASWRAATELAEVDRGARARSTRWRRACERRRRGPWPGELTAITLPAATAAALATVRPAMPTSGRARPSPTAGERLYVSAARLRSTSCWRVRRPLRGAQGGRSAVDFEDLELTPRACSPIGRSAARLRDRFAHVMVDELQDTNRVQFELIEVVAAATCSWSATRSSRSTASATPTSSCSRRAERRSSRPAPAVPEHQLPLATGDPGGAQRGVRDVLGEHFRPLVAGRSGTAGGRAAGPEPLVELLIVDKGADWEVDRPRGAVADRRGARAGRACRRADRRGPARRGRSSC